MEITIKILSEADVDEARTVIPALLSTLSPGTTIILGVMEDSHGRVGLQLKDEFMFAHVDLWVDCGTPKWRVFRDVHDIPGLGGAGVPLAHT
jgi:hypothetical protein